MNYGMYIGHAEYKVLFMQAFGVWIIVTIVIIQVNIYGRQMLTWVLSYITWFWNPLSEWVFKYWLLYYFFVYDVGKGQK